MAALLQLQHVTRRFGALEAAKKDVSLNIKQMRVLRPVGVWGCGKTTSCA
jgi:ABC-type branched-subunit amino acid transport system ATPase component